MRRRQTYLQAFRVALFGIYYAFRTQRHFRIHSMAAFGSMLGAFIFDFERWEWLILLLTIALVMVAEVLNSAIEVLASAWNPRRHVKVKLIKDLAAGAVLLAALWAFCIGLILFVPHLISFFGACRL